MVTKGADAVAPDFAELTKQLKNNVETLEKLRSRRKELKASLVKEGLLERDEVVFAEELHSVSKAIAALESHRKDLYGRLELPPVK